MNINFIKRLHKCGVLHTFFVPFYRFIIVYIFLYVYVLFARNKLQSWIKKDLRYANSYLKSFKVSF